jgi:cytochrome c553
MRKRRVLIWSAGIVIGLLLLAIIVPYVVVELRLRRVHQLPDENLDIKMDQVSIARGEHLVEVLMGCTDCHGDSLSGKYLFDDAMFGRIAAINLTPGKGGVGSTNQDADWEHAIRHGVGSDGKPLIYVMSSLYHNVGDEDLADMIAYLKNLPPVDNELPPTTVGLLSRLLVLTDSSLLPAQIIQHDHGEIIVPNPGATIEYGQYLATACKICHGADFTGRLSVGGGLNLTLAGDLSQWTEDDFRRALRTGYTPEGHRLVEDEMPWRRIGNLSDEELQALWLYLQSLPAVQGSED